MLLRPDLDSNGRRRAPRSPPAYAWAVGEPLAAGQSATVARGKTRMSYFLVSLPLWELIALVVVLPTAVAMVAQAPIHR